MTETSLQTELLSSIADWDDRRDGTVTRDTPLITSARLDSLHLLRLLLWIEEKVGRQIDATAIDIRADWDTVDQIVAFIEREREDG